MSIHGHPLRRKELRAIVEYLSILVSPLSYSYPLRCIKTQPWGATHGFRSGWRVPLGTQGRSWYACWRAIPAWHCRPRWRPRTRPRVLCPGCRASGTARSSRFDIERLASLDAVFLALPEDASAGVVPPLLEKEVRVFDLSGAFRLRDDPSGAPGVSRGDVAADGDGVRDDRTDRGAAAGARLVACAGCYPTAAVLALAPLVNAGLVTGDIVIDAKSGVSGAGKRRRSGLISRGGRKPVRLRRVCAIATPPKSSRSSGSR